MDALVIISIALLISIILNIRFGNKLILLISKNETLVAKNLELNSKLNDYDIATSIYVGCSVLYKDYKLVYKSQKHEFSVDYKLKVLEMTEDSLFVECIEFSTSDSKVNSSSLADKKAIEDFIKNKWVERDKCEMIFDESDIREQKIKKILNGIHDSSVG